jgi:hypothetical protein
MDRLTTLLHMFYNVQYDMLHEESALDGCSVPEERPEADENIIVRCWTSVRPIVTQAPTSAKPCYLFVAERYIDSAHLAYIEHPITRGADRASDASHNRLIAIRKMREDVRAQALGAVGMSLGTVKTSAEGSRVRHFGAWVRGP